MLSISTNPNFQVVSIVCMMENSWLHRKMYWMQCISKAITSYHPWEIKSSEMQIIGNPTWCHIQPKSLTVPFHASCKNQCNKGSSPCHLLFLFQGIMLPASGSASRLNVCVITAQQQLLIYAGLQPVHAMQLTSIIYAAAVPAASATGPAHCVNLCLWLQAWIIQNSMSFTYYKCL